MDQANMANKGSIPKWIVLQLLEECNLRCKMCYEWGETGSYRQGESLNYLDISEIKKIVESCKEVCPNYELFGGEPLLYPQIDEVISMITNHGSTVAMPTNGILLNKKAEMLVDAGLTYLWVSLDGPEKINDEQRGQNTYRHAVEGIKKVMEVREKKKKEYPKVGITLIVTPTNYLYLGQFLNEIYEKCKIEQVSIEFQTFLTDVQYSQYSQIIENTFHAKSIVSANGFVQDLKDYKDIDIGKLYEQMSIARDFCIENGIHFYNNPHTIDSDNYNHYFSGNWDQMIDKRTRCPFVWIHAEVSAKGDVVMCHAFYDLTFGNIYNENFIDVWNNEKSKKFRKMMKSGMLPICTACCRYHSHSFGY